MIEGCQRSLLLNILLLGKFGQLGWELQRTLGPLGNVVAWDYPEIDFIQAEALREKVLELHPEVIINAVAYTAVDRAESEPEKAFLVNAAAPGMLAEAAKRLGAVFIHYSTDYVFNGEKGSSYQEQDLPEPLNVYGHSKLAGEQAVQNVDGAYLILRTSWVYSLKQGSFVTKVLQWARTQTILHVVTDQVGSPTCARQLAEATALLLAQAGKYHYEWIAERRGLYHLAGSGFASRLDWAKEIIHLDPHPAEQVLQQLLPALTSEFPTPARRPLYSGLVCRHFESTFGLSLPAWQTALALAMES
jgi:dTDP-4-dehydrorhamnose reductase